MKEHHKVSDYNTGRRKFFVKIIIVTTMSRESEVDSSIYIILFLFFIVHAQSCENSQNSVKIDNCTERCRIQTVTVPAV